MFQFFKRKGGKVDHDSGRKAPTAPERTQSVDARAPDPDNDRTTRKDVVNLLIPETDYNQKTGVGAILQIMAGKRKRGKRKRTESCRVSPPKETQTLQRSASVVAKNIDTTSVPMRDENNQAARSDADPADFVKALVLQKYAKTPTDNNQHVSLVYVSNEPDLEEKRHAEALLREIARSIDCTVDKLNNEMGTTESKARNENAYESIPDKRIDNYKNDLKKELNLLTEDDRNNEAESPNTVKKSSLKLPKSDAEGCSDDDRSDNGRKRVTFRKHIVFDDGEQQTDDEAGSSFESLTSEEEYLEDIALNENKDFSDDIPYENSTTYLTDTNVDNENKTVININESEPITIKIENSDDNFVTANSISDHNVQEKKFQSDNSDSGFLEIGDRNNSGDDVTSVKSEVSDSESETEEIIEEIVEEEIEEVEEFEEDDAKSDAKTLVSQDSNFCSHVAALAELGSARSDEAERTRDLVVALRKQLEEKGQEIEQLKCELAAAYKESELIRQRSRSLEEELTAARSCSADLADQLKQRNEEYLRELRGELEDALTRRAELESRVLALERDREKLEQEKAQSEQKAKEALTAAEANTAKWRLAHEAARSQAAARAEIMLDDCEWKMRELEKRARDAERDNKQLTQTVEHLKANPQPSPSQIAELKQLRGLISEEQRSVQSLTLQLQKVETREEALKLELHRLKDLLEREENSRKEMEERHLQTVQRLEQNHSKAIETLKSDHASTLASTRTALERSHAERTRAALGQLRAESEQEARNAERKLREITTRFDNLKEVLSNKEAHFEAAIAEAHSKADWDILQLRHLLDKGDIEYANKIEDITQRFETEKEQLIEEWSKKVKDIEDQSAIAADEARRALETTRSKLVAERVDQLNKLKEKHRKEMEDQWEQFMTDKENCLSRMKAECRQEGEEERIKREKELLEEIRELKSQIHSKSSDFDNLAVKAAACGRTLAVTEQELREALARERELREKRSEDASKIKQVEKNSKEQIEHLTRKTACLRKLFDDMRTRLTAKERVAEQEARAKDKELHHLRGEVARLTKILVEHSSPKLGARTRADGCEMILADELKPDSRRKGSTHRAPELIRKRTCPLPDLLKCDVIKDGRPRAKSVDLPAVQVPERVKRLEGLNRE